MGATITFDEEAKSVWVRRDWEDPSGHRFAVYLYDAIESGSLRPAEPTALVLVHGHGEHIGRYADFAVRLADLGLPIIGYDHRGHGNSEGARGDAADIDHMADDLETILPYLLEETDCRRAIVFGHSMGGLVVSRLLTRGSLPSEVHRAIISAPAFRVVEKADTAIKVAIGRILARLWPKATFSTGLIANGISRDPEVDRQYEADPLVHSLISARLGKSLIDDGAAVSRAGDQVRVPLLVYHGTGDLIISIDGTREFVSSISPSLVRYHEFPGYYHEPHHEPAEDAERVFALIRDTLEAWIDGS